MARESHRGREGARVSSTASKIGSGLEHHAGAAAELVIVGGAVGIVGVGADVGNLYREQSPLDGPAQHTVPDRPFEGFREESQDVKTHL